MTTPLIWTDRDISGQAALRAACWQRVLDFTGNPELVQFASNLISLHNIPERDNTNLAVAIQKYTQQNIKFFREQPERFASPIRTILWGLGDCDDKSILIATVLRSFKIPVRLVFVVIEMIDKATHKIKKMGHVWPQAYLQANASSSDRHNFRWVSLESVRPLPFGASPIKRIVAKGNKIISTHIIGDKAYG